jgi:hypothetical protein
MLFHKKSIKLNSSRIIFSVANRKNLKWSSEWIYLGSDFLRLKSLENSLSGSRISLINENNYQASNNRKHFLKWIEDQRSSCNDSLNWWMTHLSGRNNMSSQFYNSLCQVLTLRQWLSGMPDDGRNILIVCEDIFLLKTTRKALCQEYATVSKLEFIEYVQALLYRFMHSNYALLKQCVRFWRHYRAAKKTRPVTLKRPKGEVCLIHQCLDDNSFAIDGEINCSYFKILPKWLGDQGKQVFGLAWFYNVNIPLISAYEKLRASNVLIPEDWLRPRDYIWSIFQSFKSVFSFKSSILCNGIDCSSLVLRERFMQLSDESSQFMRYIPMLKNWGQDLKKLVTYDHYENMLFEHPIRRSIHDLPYETYSIGFCHSLVSKDFLAYHYDETEWNSLVKPDLVVTSGSIGRDILIEQGVPENRVVAGSSLRSSKNPSNITTHDDGDILILLSLSLESCIEILNNINYHSDWIDQNLNVKVRVKTHPMMKYQLLLDEMGWDELPDNWSWENGNISDALINAKCCVAQMTASVYDAVLSGCIVLPIMSELQQMDNYLDIFEDQCPEVKSVSIDKVRDRLDDIFINKREVYNDAFNNLRKLLLDGINPVNDVTLRTFLH